MVIEDLQEFQSLNPIKATQTLPQFTLHSNKLQEAYAGLSTSCDINHITDTFSGLLAFTAQDWVRQGARIIGVLISLVTGGLKELLSSFSSGDYEKAGFLTGKYRKNEPLPESKRAEGRKRAMTEKNFALLFEMEAMALPRKATISQIALAWVMSDAIVTSPIIGATSIAQLNENLGAMSIHLTEGERAILDKMSAWKTED